MSSKRKRRKAGRSHLVRTRGAFTPKREVELAPVPKDVQDGSEQMFREGQGRRQPPKPQKATLWAKHDCDTDPIRYGKRHAGRDVRKPWGAHFLIMREWPVESFRARKGLKRTAGRFGLYIQGRRMGYHDDDAYALAWARAATDAGYRDVMMVPEIAV